MELSTLANQHIKNWTAVRIYVRLEWRHNHMSVPNAFTVLVLPVSFPRSPISSSIIHSSASHPPRWMQEKPANPSPCASISQFEERPHLESLAFTWKCLKSWSTYFPSRAKAKIAWINWKFHQFLASYIMKNLPCCWRRLPWWMQLSLLWILWGQPNRHPPPLAESASQLFLLSDRVSLSH